MARNKSENKFLTLEEFEEFEALLAKKLGEKKSKWYHLAAEIMGVTYGGIKPKFLRKHLEIAVRDNMKRVFEIEKLELENKELQDKLTKIKEI